MKLKNLKAFILGAPLPFLAGCGLVRATIITAAAAVGLVGYVVYETGDAAVTGIKNVATATGDATSSTGKAVGKVIFFNGKFKTEHPYGIRYVAMGATTAMHNAGFREVKNSTDGLSGRITAKTREETEITIDLKNIKPDRTSVIIRFGVAGNLEESEKINNMITSEMDLMYKNAASDKNPKEASQ